MPDKKKSEHSENHILPGLGTRLIGWRKMIPLKAFELAKILVVSQGSLSDIENNKSLPSANTLASLRKHTDIDMDYLFFGETLDKKNTVRGPRYREELISVKVDNPGTYALVKKG